MSLSYVDCLWIIGLCVICLWTMIGLKKCHVMDAYRILDVKSKKIMLVFAALFAIVASILLNTEVIIYSIKPVGFNNIFNKFAELAYRDNIYAYKMVQFFVILFPAVLVLISCIIKILNWKDRMDFPVYFLFIFVIINKYIYCIAKGDWNIDLLFLLCVMVLCVLEHALQNKSFNKKIVLYLIPLLGVIAIICSWCSLKILWCLVMALITIGAEILVMILALKYTVYLRITWRRILKILYILLIWYVNLKS